MKFFMEKNKDTSYRVTIHIPKKIINSFIFTEFIKIRKKININGFRKGKIPIKIIQEQYGNKVYYDVFAKLMQKFFHEFLNKEKIKIIGTPKYQFDNDKDKKKEYLTYSVLYEKYPEFQIKKIRDLEVKRISVIIKKEDVLKKLEELTIDKKIWISVNKPIKINNRVTINYSVYEKNKKIKKFETKNISFIISKNTFISNLETKIINHIVNDIIFFKIKFHEFYPEEELQKKDIIFKIKIVKIEQEEEKNKENIKKEIQKINELQYQTIQKNFKNQIDQISEKYLENQIIDNIIEKNIISIPKSLYKEKIEVFYEKYKKEYKEKKCNILEKKFHVDLNTQVKRKLCKNIITEIIVFEKKLSPNEKNIYSLIKNMFLDHKKQLEMINLYKKNNNFKNVIQKIELERQVARLLTKNVKIIEQNWTFDQFLNYQWENHQELYM